MWPMVAGLKTYTFFYVFSMFACLGSAVYFCRRMEIPRKVGVALGGCYVFGMAVGARILCDILNHRLHCRNYLDLHYYFTNGLWGGPLAYLAVAVTGVALLGRDRAKLFDLVAMTLPIPMIFAKVACFVNGCCYGAPSDIPWALGFPVGAEAPAGVLRHPTQLYEIAVLVVIALALWELRRARQNGTLLLWFVLIYGMGRPLTEHFRAAPERVPRVGAFTASQVTCMGAALLAAVALLALRDRRAGVPRALPLGGGVDSTAQMERL